MQVYHFSEMAYHPAWEAGKKNRSFRVTLPNREFDPEVGATLLNRYLDEFVLCDELGMNIMLNEHHSTATCLTASCNVPLSILARQTKKARLLALGNPIAHRPDPVRVAEECAMIDVISRGRLEMGLVKAAPYEIHPANGNPGRLMDRFWEAHDLILKAMSTHDGPFNWEGEYYHYRNVNIWPRPYQAPHPPVWITALSAQSGRDIAERGHIAATLLSGQIAKGLFDAYRQRAAELGWTAGVDRFAYAVLIGCGDTEEEGKRFGHEIADYVRTSPIVGEPFRNPAGYASVAANVAMMRQPQGLGVAAIKTASGKLVDQLTASVEDFMEARTVFAGNPDQVFEQIKTFYNEVGGFGHLIMMGQGGHISHQDTVKNLSLFAKEVLPRLAELKAPEPRAAAAAAR